MSTYDLTTGEGSVYETYSKSSDILLGLDDALRFIEKYPPREIILENKLNDNEIIANMKIEDILLYLNIDIFHFKLLLIVIQFFIIHPLLNINMIIFSSENSYFIKLLLIFY